MEDSSSLILGYVGTPLKSRVPPDPPSILGRLIEEELHVIPRWW